MLLCAVNVCPHCRSELIDSPWVVIVPGQKMHKKPREGKTLHSAKICVTQPGLKKKISEGCKKFRNIAADSPLKRTWLKTEEASFQRKENDRLHLQMTTFRAAEHPVDPANTYKIKSSKLYKNGDVIDEFNFSNQLFHQCQTIRIM